MIKFECQACGKQYELKNQRRRVFCSCGVVSSLSPQYETLHCFGPGDAMKEIMDMLGIHEKSGCSCEQLAAKMNEIGVDGCLAKEEWVIEQLRRNAKKYSWLDTICVAVKNLANPLAIAIATSGDIYKAIFDAAINLAKSRAIRTNSKPAERFAKGLVGVVSPVFNRVGGTETYWRMLHSYLGISGLVTPSQPLCFDAGFPVAWGRDAITELASSVNNLLVWGVTDAKEITKGPRRIAMHHGSLASTWANSVFENQLDWCEDAVAINQDVAKHYGVTYIGNAVDQSRIVGTPYTKTKKVVLWLHRESEEKRPWLVKRIAELMPDDWTVVASLSQCQNGKIECIGTIDHPGNWLATADVFLSTADQEGFGYSVAEAMAAGVPVVSSPFGIAANSDLVEQVNSDEPRLWLEAILRAGPKAAQARRFTQKHHNAQAWVNKWLLLLNENSLERE